MSRVTVAYAGHSLGSMPLSNMLGWLIFILNVLGKKRRRSCREK